MSVHEIAQEVKSMREDVNDVNKRIKIIEDKPGKKYEAIVEKVVLVMITAAVTYFMSGGSF
jgi:hypothetical protein